MATTTTGPTKNPDLDLSAQDEQTTSTTSANSTEDLENFQLLDDVFRHRATDKVQTPLIAFPRSEGDVAQYEYFTGQDMDRYTNQAAWHYTRLELRTSDLKRVALLGPTNLDWVSSLFGLSRAGYTILALSPRLSSQAIVKLMEETYCESLIYHPSAQLVSTVNQVKAVTSAQTLSILPRSGYDRPGSIEVPFHRNVNLAEERKRYAIIVHSSGSTGLPKPTGFTHARYTQPYPIGPGKRDFMTLPLYHSFALDVCPARMYQRTTIFFLNSNLPLTCEGLTVAMKEAQPTVLYAVPYVLKLLGEQHSGIEVLRSCRQVLYTGSQCPDDLGDRLVNQGVNLSSLMGSSECGLLGTSVGRPPGDDAWAYIRPPPQRMKNIWTKPIDNNTFEFVFLRDYPSRVVSNSDDPPESFHSRDIFTPHASIPGAWKFLGRLDDRVTLLNGEKVLPLPIEGIIREAALVREAVVFGIGKSIPGLLLFRAEAAKSFSDEDFVSSVLPKVKIANRSSEGFSQIDQNMVVPLPAGIEIPMTDKGAFIRAQVYSKFEQEIENAYKRLEEHQDGSLELDLPSLEKYLLTLSQQVLGPQVSDIHVDFFSLGMSSLQAIQMRGSILRDLDLGGNGKKLGQNVVFEEGNIKNLAKNLHNLRLNQEIEKEKSTTVMKDRISKYSDFERFIPSSTAAGTFNKHTIVLTGATGSLGAYILARLIELPSVEKVYCLLRGDKPDLRLQKSFDERGLAIVNPSKLSILTSNFVHSDLGLEASTYDLLLSQTTDIIHCAWPVNFQLSLRSLEPQIQGLHNLLQLSLRVHFSTPARFLFCSSISAALATPRPARVPEAPIDNLAHASFTGYAKSKLVGERVVQAAVDVAGANATIFRIGQVVGDTKNGLWNDTESFPLIVKSALTMGILPKLNMACEWLPVDTLAEIIVEISGLLPSLPSKNGLDNASAPAKESSREDRTMKSSDNDILRQQTELVYNIRSPYPFSWTSQFLPALSSAGLTFSPVSRAEWLEQLRALSTTLSTAELERNPAIKLIDFFEATFAEEGDGESDRIVFEIDKAKKQSSALRNAPMVVESGLARKMLAKWMEKWGEGEKLRRVD